MKPKVFLKHSVLLAVAMTASGQTAPNIYRVVNLVSNVAGSAPVVDANLVDPWGISNTNSPFWVSNHVTGNSTVYNAAGVVSATVVTIPSASGTGTGKPTGQVQGGGLPFPLANGNNASFIFATEDGLITAWNAGSGTVAEIKVNNSANRAVYKGLAIGTSAAGGTLYAANFRAATIDTWGPGFSPVSLAGSFIDAGVPSGYAPFNIQNLGGSLYVEYAKQDSAKALDVGGAGNGFVSVFDLNGNLLRHLIFNGALNSPWGVAIAPANWGSFGGALLVGNFGDGRINAFNLTTGTLLGVLQDATGSPIQIPGLWGMFFGTGTRADANTLYFVAGMPDGSTTPRGLLGSIAPPSAITAVVNSASWMAGPIAPGELITLVGQTVGVSPLVANPIPATGTIGTTLAGVSVTINNVAAPMIYTSGSATSIQVPNILILSSTANIVLQTPGQTSSITVPMGLSAPGLFAANAAGFGQLAALNQDGTVNSPTNPAAGGTTVTFYETGEGATNPAGLDGAIQAVSGRVPFQPVFVKIGGQSTSVVSASTPVGKLSGLMEVRAVVPIGLTPGPAPVVLSLGPPQLIQSSTTQTVSISVK
jgi:uncharacterized protein (TIGR03118 family)